MGTKWSTVSTSTYHDGGPSDDGSATAANRVKFATIMSDLTDPLDTAIDLIVAKLNQLFDEVTTPVATSRTTTASDHAHILEVTNSAIITLLAAATAGPGYRVGLYASGADASFAVSGADTIDGGTSVTVRNGGLTWATVNAAGTGYLTNNTSNSPSLSGGKNPVTASNSDETSVPSWAKKLTIMLDDISTNGTSPILIQLGTASGFVATGYNVVSATHPNGGGGVTAAFTTGFGIQGASASAIVDGALTLTLVETTGAQTWVGTGVFSRQDTPVVVTTAGIKQNLGVLDRIRLTTVGGTDVFDSGFWSILYE